MASLQMHLLMLVLLLPLVTGFVSIRHTCVEDKLLRRFNYWRAVLGGIPSVDSNKGAVCVAEKIADKLEHQQHCKPISPKGPEAKFSNYPKQLSECKIDPNTTRDGAVLMVECVTNVAVVSFNFTQSKFVQYLNNTTKFF
ncbi:hypothetical protein Scep_030426 [Stephania cephalantha]|uniref:Uncharacterized GPI-anchored protein At5g19230-like domain-containing protein n=1 Tax=Stephania cephalantha TaxID=152367 RepID=A0AAP0HIM0_9MAGN